MCDVKNIIYNSHKNKNDIEEMYKAFSLENKTNDFDRNVHYKNGFFSY